MLSCYSRAKDPERCPQTNANSLSERSRNWTQCFGLAGLHQLYMDGDSELETTSLHSNTISSSGSGGSSRDNSISDSDSDIDEEALVD
jgi:hypothetical protein